MTSVNFQIHRFTTDIEEFNEQAFARLLNSERDFVASLTAEGEGIEGAIMIDEASILDDLGFATQHLCFEAVEQLVVPGATFEYGYFTSNAQATLVSLDGMTIVLSGEYISTCEFSREDLLPALYECGLRYLGFLEELGRRGRAWSATDLAQLRPFADRARAALIAHGFRVAP